MTSFLEIPAYLWNNQDVREDDGSIEGKTSQRLDKRKTFVFKKRDNLHRSVVISSQYTVALLPNILKENKRIKMF